MLAVFARSKPGRAFCPRLAMTWHICAGILGGDEVASMRACRFVPVPEIRTRIWGSFCCIIMWPSFEAMVDRMGCKIATGVFSWRKTLYRFRLFMALSGKNTGLISLCAQEVSLYFV